MWKKLGAGKAGRRTDKGFYIVLFLCAAVLGTSSWIALAGTKTDVEEIETAEAVETLEDEAPVAEESVPVMAEAEPVQAEMPAEPVAVKYEAPVEAAVQKPYSIETLMYDATLQDWRTHTGVDYACAEGTAIVAVADGTVERIYNDALLGTSLVISHPDGLQSVYSNLAENVYVQSGDAISRGQILGVVGTSAIGESAEASHLHFAMKRDGVSVDPTEYIG